MKTPNPVRIIDSTQTCATRTLCLSLLILLSGCLNAVTQDNAYKPSEKIVNQSKSLFKEELINLVGPIALFPDDLLALTLEASRQPLQVVSASRMKKNTREQQAARPNWDDSIIALLNYPEVLEMLDRDLEWTEKLSRAIKSHPVETMQAIEQFRDQAYRSGNLKSDSYQIISVKEGRVIIDHQDREKIYIPYYDPDRVRVRQNKIVYHYYPTAYPVYYYPYPLSIYQDEPFFGIDSVFGLAWDRYYLSRHSHSHFLHPYYGHAYSPRHFNRRFSGLRHTRKPSPALSKRFMHRRDRSLLPSGRNSFYGDNVAVFPEKQDRKKQSRQRASYFEPDSIRAPKKTLRILDKERAQRQAIKRDSALSSTNNKNPRRYPEKDLQRKHQKNGMTLEKR